jgi:predicted P-loop ATPase
VSQGTAAQLKALLRDPLDVATRLELADDPRRVLRQAGGITVLCPAHKEDTPSCSLRTGPDGTLQAKCFGCDFAGDIYNLIAAVDGLDPKTDFPAILKRAAELAGREDLAGSAASGPRTRQEPKKSAPKYPSRSEVDALLAACVSVATDDDVRAYLESRGLHAKRVAELKLALALPTDAAAPAWARFGRPWAKTGHRLLFAVVDHLGEVQSVRAGRITDATSPKRVPPKGFSTAGLVLANPAAVAMLRGDAAPAKLVVVEGEPDWLVWATRTDLPVIGVLSGSWTSEIAARVPDGAQVVVRTHHDPAGDKYAAEVRISLGDRCSVLRSSPYAEPMDENDALLSGALPADPFEGAGAGNAPDVAPDSEHDADWKAGLVYKPGKQRELVRVAANAVTVLANDPAWSKVFAWDAFGESVVTLRPPPWDAHDAPAYVELGPWTDSDTTRVGAWLSRHWGLHIASTVLDEAIAVVARRHHVHAVRDYLASLSWDGTPRINTWLSACAGCPDTEYTRAVGSKFLISAVARACSPGSKVDTVVVFEGPQGAKKSTLIRTLCSDPKWFLETQSDVGSKDSMQQLRRRWIVELGEIDALSRAEMARVKHFFSTQVDTYRASYGRHSRDYPRQCVFIGSTNASVYLPDPTGGRRFWPVRVGTIDLERLKAERDQLWAEAFARFQAGEAWHIESRELARIFQREQEARHAGDPWESTIAGWINSAGHPERRRDGVTTGDVLRDALLVDVSRWTRADEMRVGAVLRRLGWERGAPESHAGNRARRYRPQVVQVVQEVDQTDSEEPARTSSSSAQPDHPYAGAYTHAHAHARAHAERSCETGSAGSAGGSAPREPTDEPAREPGANGMPGEAPFADWWRRQEAS